MTGDESEKETILSGFFVCRQELNALVQWHKSMLETDSSAKKAHFYTRVVDTDHFLQVEEMARLSNLAMSKARVAELALAEKEEHINMCDCARTVCTVHDPRCLELTCFVLRLTRRLESMEEGARSAEQENDSLKRQLARAADSVSGTEKQHELQEDCEHLNMKALNPCQLLDLSLNGADTAGAERENLSHIP